jgi:transposase
MNLSNRSFEGKRVVIGVDVHKKTYALCILVDDTRRSLTFPADPVALARWLKRTFHKAASIETVYEAGFAGFTLHRALEGAGISNLVVNPASIPVAANARVKTDKRDAKRMAELRRAGELVGIHVPTVKEELARLLSRTRAQLVTTQSRLGNQIKSKLMEFGFWEPDDDRAMSFKLLAEIQAQDLPAELSVSIRCLAAVYKEAHAQMREMEKQLAEQAASDEVLEAIYRSIPGSGPVTSRVLASELRDMSRFHNQRQLSSYTGLTPSERSSGESVRKGGITHQGNTQVRHCLIELAWRAIRKDDELKERYSKLKIRRGGKKAIVAIARILIGRVRACLRDGVPYRIVQVAS